LRIRFKAVNRQGIFFEPFFFYGMAKLMTFEVLSKKEKPTDEAIS
jgi:hypothetical protein